ncbi:hypothetical protein B0H14DRAFT_2756700 [Mycena olivaceomarginata]|nr:hypothetical protein B0H14DRAFT_2756700 [Mycena olivaceomarginata]
MFRVDLLEPSPILCFEPAQKPSAIAEDAANKPWRHIPTALISPRQATVFRCQALLPICLFISGAYNVTVAGIAFAAIILLHNEFGMDSHWVTRSLLNAAGYATFYCRATLIARG